MIRRLGVLRHDTFLLHTKCCGVAGGLQKGQRSHLPRLALEDQDVPDLNRYDSLSLNGDESFFPPPRSSHVTLHYVTRA